MYDVSALGRWSVGGGGGIYRLALEKSVYGRWKVPILSLLWQASIRDPYVWGLACAGDARVCVCLMRRRALPISSPHIRTRAWNYICLSDWPPFCFKTL